MVTLVLLAYFGGHCCYHSNSKINSRLLNVDYSSIKAKKEIGENPILYFSLMGGGRLNSLSMHAAMSYAINTHTIKYRQLAHDPPTSFVFS